MDKIKDKYQKTQKHENVNIKIQGKAHGVLPIFLFQFTGKKQYEECSDFVFEVRFEQQKVNFAIRIFNRKISEQSMQQFMMEFIERIKQLF